MPTFIKTGLWEKRAKGLKGELNLDRLISQFAYSREVLSFPVPALNDTISVTPTAIDTIIVFEGTITDNFTIDVDASSSTPGDRIYLMMNGNATITFTGDILVTLCGDQDNQYSLAGNVCIEEIYNGTEYIGIDIC